VRNVPTRALKEGYVIVSTNVSAPLVQCMMTEYILEGDMEINSGSGSRGLPCLIATAVVVITQ
jgi:hypothetical protein